MYSRRKQGFTDVGPVAWPSRTRDRRALNLTEVAIVRRLRQGEKSGEIARAMRISPEAVSQARRRMRMAFGVDTDQELIEHPEVIAQISE